MTADDATSNPVEARYRDFGYGFFARAVEDDDRAFSGHPRLV